jgi:ketosteroid isomerase-like protein
LASFAREFELSGGTYAVELHDVLADDDHTVALLRGTAQRDGKGLDMNYVLVFHIGGGRITEAWELWTDQRVLDEFWS